MLSVFDEIINLCFLVDGKGTEAHGRILNGKVVVPHSLPYQVGLACEPGIKEILCGGALITPSYVLTGTSGLG